MVLGGAALALGNSFPTDARAGWLLLSGLLGFAVGDSLYFAAFPRCGVQLAAILGNLVPPGAALLAWLFLGDALPPVALFGMLVSLSGIALVVVDGRARAANVDRRTRWIGIGFGLANAAAQAVAILTGRIGFEGGTELLPGTVVRLLGGVSGALVLSLVMGLRGGPRRATRDLVGLVRPFGLPLAWRLFFVASVIGAVVNLPLHSHALGELSPGVSAILFATTPLWTLPIGLRLGQRYGWRTAVGTLAGFGGVSLVVSALA